MQATPVHLGRKYRLYPSPVQAERLAAWGHTCRTIWNTALEQRQFAWQQRRRWLTAFDQAPFLTEGRREYDWLADLPAQCGQQVLRRLDHAYALWRDGHHELPRYHKRTTRLSVPFTSQQVAVRRLSRRWGQVKLPKLGWARFRWSRDLPGVLRVATVITDGTGMWHLTLAVAVDREPVLPNGKPGCGVDYGVECSAFVSDEDGPRLMRRTLSAGEQRRLVGLQRRHRRQAKFADKHNGGLRSRRMRKTEKAIAVLRATQARRRLDFTHNLTTDLAKNHGWVAIEDLRVFNMTASAKGTVERPGRNVRAKAALNRVILDGTPGERRRQLEYKTPLYGSELRVVSARFTSQTCSVCGVTDKASRPGCGRVFACTACGHTEHADKNAAINIADRARRAAGLNSTRRHLVPSLQVTGRRLREPSASVA